MNLKKRLLKTLILCCVGLAIGGGVALFQISMEKARMIDKGYKPVEGAMKMAGVNIGGPFILTNHLGENVTEKDFEGQYKLIYFGFTYCPAICPTELQKMATVVKKLNQDEAKKLQQLFISIDPERDTAAVLKDYVSLFHPDLVGLTGTVPQIQDIMQRYRIFATKVESESLSDYTIDHSTFIYLMGPENELLSIYRMRDGADYILQDIRSKLSEQKAS